MHYIFLPLSYTPAALLKPACNIVPHVVWFKGVKQEVGGFNELCCFLVLSEFAGKKKNMTKDSKWENIEIFVRTV